MSSRDSKAESAHDNGSLEPSAESADHPQQKQEAVSKRSPKTRKQRTPRQRWILRVSYAAYIGLLLYGGFCLFFWIRYQRGSPIPMTDVELVWRHHYHELWEEKLFEAKPSLSDDRYDVLLLGGSVAEQVADNLQAELEAHSKQEVRVYSVARSAHNSRDSFLKFGRLKDKEFDCVIVYNGINDVAMNYVEGSLYRDDYSHCGWYASFQRRLKAGRMSMTEISSDLLQSISRQPRPDDLQYGDNIKTARSVQSNLSSIASQAAQNGSTVVLMSFASYIPTNYTKARFRAGELDYSSGQFDMPVEQWGRVKDITKMLAVQNKAVRQLAEERKTVWVDQAELIQGPQNFCDVCHLSPAGCELFAKNTVAALKSQSEFK
jgi:hypothetical protein